MKDFEIGIVDIVGVLRKHKRLIAAATAVCALAAAVFVFSRPRIREVEAVFYPARIPAIDVKGNPTTLMVLPFQTLAGQLKTRELVPYIAKKSGLSLEDVPQIHVEAVPETNQVWFYIRDPDIEDSKLALTALLQILEANMNDMLDAKLAVAESNLLYLDGKTADLEAGIREAEQDIAALDLERHTAESRFTASFDEEKALSQKIWVILEKNAGLKHRHAALSSRSDPDSAREIQAVSNLILANAMMADSYSESLKSERAKRDDLDRRVAEIAELRGRVESRIALLRNDEAKIRAARARWAETAAGAIRAHVIQGPSAFSRPVNPPKAFPIILGAALGFLLSFFPAVFIEIGKRAAQS